MTLSRPRGVRRCRALALVVVLVLSLCLCMLMGGTGLQVVTQLGLSKTERDYERALMLAEAGANAYLSRLTFGTAGYAYLPPLYQYMDGIAPTCSEFKQGVQNGLYELIRVPSGSQQGYFAGTLGRPGSRCIIVAYGWSNGVVRSARITANVARAPSSIDGETALTFPGDYAIYAVSLLTLQNNLQVTGKVGTNGLVVVQNNNVITGGLELNGPHASVVMGLGNQFARMPFADPLLWPTVSSIALKQFPASGGTAPGGLDYLALHNDNASIRVNGAAGSYGPRLVLRNGESVTFTGKSGGANYYLEELSFVNMGSVTLDNALGPVTIWIGPRCGSGGWFTKNGVSITQTVTGDISRWCRVYIATTGGMTGKNNVSGDLGLYSYDKTNDGAPIGYVEANNNLGFTGSIVANHVALKNNAEFTVPYFTPDSTGVYRVSLWAE
ncbi:MAG: hypothetical protein NT029_19860 [Armatimonadetes bacterium]|nr:hypothetical protein [Armatimonadota bacterium]